jgi:hypothetical protein
MEMANPESSASGRARAQFVGAIKTLEDVREVFGKRRTLKSKLTWHVADGLVINSVTDADSKALRPIANLLVRLVAQRDVEYQCVLRVEAEDFLDAGLLLVEAPGYSRLSLRDRIVTQRNVSQAPTARFIAFDKPTKSS